MSFEEERNRRRKTDRPAGDSSPAQTATRKKKRRESPELGQALRSVYDSTVNERIPSEMLDLLGKLA